MNLKSLCKNVYNESYFLTGLKRGKKQPCVRKIEFKEFNMGKNNGNTWIKFRS